MTLPTRTEASIPGEAGQAPKRFQSEHGIKRLMVEALRTAMFKRPHWDGVPASPLIVAVLTLCHFGLSLLFDRLVIVGPATFYWPTVNRNLIVT